MSKAVSKARQAMGLQSLKSLGINELPKEVDSPSQGLREARADNLVVAALIFPVAAPGLFGILSGFNPFVFLGAIALGCPVGLCTAIIYMALVRVVRWFNAMEVRGGAGALFGIAASLACWALLALLFPSLRENRSSVAVFGLAGGFSGFLSGHFFPVGDLVVEKRHRS